MKGLIASAEREFKLIFRNGITLYLVIAPALLALVFLFVFGSVQKASVSFVVDKSVTQETVSKLATVADIEVAADNDALVRRVSGADSIAGLMIRDGQIKLLVEGNEAEGFAQSRRSLVAAALSGDTVDYTAEAVLAKSSPAYDVSMACIFLLALFIGGATQGLGGVTERESGVIKAVKISPMTLAGYVASKLLPAVLFGAASAAVCALIIGGAQTLLPFILTALCSIFVSGIIAFLIIAFADNQVAAVGVLKIIMPVFLVAGVSAAFIPASLLPVFYPLPMYWQFAAVKAIMAHEPAIFPMLMIVLTGLLWFAVVMIIFVKKTAMKVWR